MINEALAFFGGFILAGFIGEEAIKMARKENKEKIKNLRIDVKCYLEDEEELDTRIVNKVKSIFAKYMRSERK